MATHVPEPGPLERSVDEWRARREQLSDEQAAAHDRLEAGLPPAGASDAVFDVRDLRWEPAGTGPMEWLVVFIGGEAFVRKAIVDAKDAALRELLAAIDRGVGVPVDPLNPMHDPVYAAARAALELGS